MSDSIIKAQNLQTVVAVSFVLALLSLGMNFYNITQLNQLTAGMLDLEAASIKANIRSEADLQKQILELNAKISKLEAERAAQASATPADVAEAEPARKPR